MYIVVY